MVCAFYGRFLTNSASTAPTIAFATMIAIAEPRTYVSVINVGAGVGTAVTAGACITVNLSSDPDGQ